MSVIATAVKHLLAAGVGGDDLVRAIAEMEAAMPACRDDAADRRRERDRAYQAEKRSERRQNLPTSADSADTPSTPAPSSPQTPHQPHPHTPGNNNTRARGSRLPADFELPDDWRQWAMKDRSWSTRDADEEGEAFRDYWRGKAGKDGIKADWPATWRNWCRNSRRSERRLRAVGSDPGW